MENLYEMLLYPYHIQRTQALKEGDFLLRAQFCDWFEERRVAVHYFEKKILFTDEAGFTRNGIFNFHNNHEWAAENPHAIVQRGHQQRFSLNVWGGIIDEHLIGPVFLPQRLNEQLTPIFYKMNYNNYLKTCHLTYEHKCGLCTTAPPHILVLSLDSIYKMSTETVG